jgi:NarL family two-component system response regulator LiaR
VLLDVLMPRVDGFTALRQIKAESPATHTLLLTSHIGEEHIFEATRAGATSYVSNTDGVAEVVGSVRAASRGESVLDTTVAARVLRELRAPAHNGANGNLTRREVEWLTRLARGRSIKEIAARVYTGEETVKTHVSNIRAKRPPNRRHAAGRQRRSYGIPMSRSAYALMLRRKCCQPAKHRS